MLRALLASTHAPSSHSSNDRADDLTMPLTLRSATLAETRSGSYTGPCKGVGSKAASDGLNEREEIDAPWRGGSASCA